MKETIKVAGMTCSCCVGKVKKSINELDGISSIDINVDTEEVQVDFNPNTVALAQVKEKIAEAGYKMG